MADVIKIVKDSNYDYRWSVDGNKYGDKYDITSEDGFGDLDLVKDGWEEVLAVNGSLFYSYDGKYFAEGLEKSRGVNNQELEMSAVTDFNNAMAIGVDTNGNIVFDRQYNIMKNLGSYYGAITGMGIMKDGYEVDWGYNEFKSQWNTISGRTIIGTDKDGNYMDYSFAGTTGSSGKRVSELYPILKDLGFYNAIVFDGGGSVFLRKFGKYLISTSRKVKNALILYRKKKTTPEPTGDKVPFLPRLSKDGMLNNKYWYDEDYNVGADGALMLPNCTTYACGRFGELNNQNMRNMMKNRTGFGDAKEWYANTKYDKGATPKVGSIACFGGDYGHVAIVERVNADGTVLVSQSNYREKKSYDDCNYFQTATYTLEVGKTAAGVCLPFQGYIYPPNLKDEVVRDTTKKQVRILADQLRVRDAANGNWIEGRFACKNALYDILDMKDDWARIEDGIWVKLNDSDGWTQTLLPEQPEDEKDKIIKELKAQVADLQSQVDNLTKTINTLQVENTALKQENAALEKDIVKLKENLNKINALSIEINELSKI